MNWNTVLIVVIAVLAAVAAWQLLKIRDAVAQQKWENGISNCPLTSSTPTRPIPGETQWDRLLREVGDPADISTSGAEFAMPEAKN